MLKIHRLLSRALKVAVQRQRVARNVCTLVDPPRVEQVEVEPLTEEEARRILHVAANQRNGARWSVALALGLRQGGALGLLWEDIDLDAGTLAVRRSLERRPWAHGCPDGHPCGQRPARCPARTGGGWILSQPKSRAGRRPIALPHPLVTALRQHKGQQARERLLAGTMWQDHDFVFATEDGRPIQANRDWMAWKALLGEASVRDARLNDARHTAATLLLTQGVHPRVAMQILGHSQVSLTLNTYSHVMPEVAREASDLVGAALWGPTSTVPSAAPNGHRNDTGPENHDHEEGLQAPDSLSSDGAASGNQNPGQPSLRARTRQIQHRPRPCMPPESRGSSRG